MRTVRTFALLCCFALPVPAVILGQRLTVVLDPARGGNEDGPRIDEHTPEKQVTLDVANRLRALLSARDFDVVLTRSTDVAVTNDARAAVANGSKAIACISLHATAAGKGLHLFTSSLTPAAPEGYAVPWDGAQALYVQRSQRLAGELATAFGRSKIPVSSGRTWIRPLDNMECPAVAVEIAPDGDGETAADRAYQTRIAETIAGAMLFWRGHADVVQSIVGAPPVVAAPVTAEPKPAAAPGGGAVKEVVPGAAKPAGAPGTPKPVGAGAAANAVRPQPVRAVPIPGTEKSPGVGKPAESVPTDGQTAAPKPVAPKPVVPKPVTPGAVAPKPVLPKQTVPKQTTVPVPTGVPE